MKVPAKDSLEGNKENVKANEKVLFYFYFLISQREKVFMLQ